MKSSRSPATRRCDTFKRNAILFYVYSRLDLIYDTRWMSSKSHVLNEDSCQIIQFKLHDEHCKTVFGYQPRRKFFYITSSQESLPFL